MEVCLPLSPQAPQGYGAARRPHQEARPCPIHATRLALAEAPIDALSLAALERLRPDTIYAATGGGMGDGTISAIAQILAGLDRSAAPELASAADADDAGEHYAVRHAELARSAGIPFVRLTPTVGADWNDVLKERGA